MQKGDYVLATKYRDGDPGDNWCVGFYDHEDKGRHYVTDADGKQFRANGFRRVGSVAPDYAEWLLSNAAAFETSPPGSVNLWGMMGEFATLSDEPE